ncbi:E3 ubiquitin-protein ligase MSL2-like [Babylonia areolata]|uniref:E3 ubiquitin-protein ligase MSL2-like n=1 Tax=Babylonia areolata TaxID=304850 RepID=UPI003FD1EC9D
MNAYEYYLSTCKYMLLADPSNKSSWVDLYSYLPCLRQMLSCCVCGNILLKPKGPSHGICLHHVCSSCVGGKMRLRPACSWCRTHEGFVENPGMRLLVLCFKKMCVFINNSDMGEQIRKAGASVAHTNTLIRVLDEAVAFEDDYVICNKVMPTCVPTYGMAPEPKLVSFPRGPQVHTPGHSAATTGRGRSDSAVSLPQSPHSPTPLTTAQSEVKTLDRHTADSSQIVIGEELNKMPALLAPCTHGIVSPEKLSPPLAGPQRADVHDQQDQWMSVTRSGPQHEEKTQVPHDTSSSEGNMTVLHDPHETSSAGDNVAALQVPHDTSSTEDNMTVIKVPPETSSTEDNTTVTGQNQGATPPLSKVKKEAVGPAQCKLKLVKVRGKYKKKKAHKQDIDFEPPCKRTRLASSLSVSGGLAQPSRKVCNCAYLNQPSRLTCSGQRCPCYSSQQACVSCLCRGCRNPCTHPTAMTNGDGGNRSDGEHDLTMPTLSPESTP